MNGLDFFHYFKCTLDLEWQHMCKCDQNLTFDLNNVHRLDKDMYGILSVKAGVSKVCEGHLLVTQKISFYKTFILDFQSSRTNFEICK